MKLRAIIPRIKSSDTKACLRTRMPGFDATYYLYWYRDTAQYGDGLLEHYLRIGWKEGRDPSAGFSTDGYLAGNADVRASGDNPLIHFLDYGFAEGRRGWEKVPGQPAPKPRVLLPETIAASNDGPAQGGPERLASSSNA